MFIRSALPRVLAVIAIAGTSFSVCRAQNDPKPETVPFPAKKEQPAATTPPAATQPTATPGAAKPAAAPAAPQPTAKEQVKRWADLLTDWMHYVRTDNFEMAEANAKALLDAGVTDEQLTALVDDNQSLANRFIDTVIRAQKKPQIEKSAAQLQAKYNRGRLAHSRDSAEITRNLKLLTGNQNERSFAMERLLNAGEYGMPQLLTALLDKSDAVRQAQVRRVVVEMGRASIIPLCTALPSLEANNQELVVGVLGDLVNPYTTSLPFLYELREETKSDSVRTACERSIQRIAGAVNTQIPVSTRFETLAVEYYNESRSLTSFPREEYQLLWNFDTGSGLFATPIATPVYHEAMAMRMAEKSLKHDAGNAGALALWIAANFSREIDTPQGYDNPSYSKDRREATYYAVAAGSGVCERVLARALDDKDTPLARRAIAAMERTAGANAMLTAAVASRRPLLEAVAYPNRRVQYDAALAVGAAKPGMDFPGADRIVPTLASAIRDAAARYAIVLGNNANDQNATMELLRARGYTVLPPGNSLSSLRQSISETPGIDLIVAQNLAVTATDSLIQEVRSDPRLAATPILALLPLQGYLDLSKKYEGDSSTRVAREGLNAEQIGAATDQLIEAAVGGAITSDEAREYKLHSLAVLRDLAISGNSVLKVSYAAGPLTTALKQNSGVVKLRIAEVMGYLNDKSVQVALMDEALAASGDEQIVLLGYVASAAKLYGNQLEPRQISQLVKLAMGSGPDAQATAAAALMGALNLPNADLIPLILNGSKK